MNPLILYNIHRLKNEFKDIVDKTGVNINKLFNTHGVKYRELNLKEKLKDMSDDEKTRTTCFRWNVG